MPFLRFKGFEKNFLKQISPLLIEQFSDIANIPIKIAKKEGNSVKDIPVRGTVTCPSS
jgi:hypothetical protein